MSLRDGISEIPITSGKIVISNKRAQNFKHVLENLGSSNHVYISTFNYYMEKEFNDTILKKIDYLNDIRVVLNAYNFETINKIIEKSLCTNRYVQFYYSENNHSKIISNGDSMYIGSANYTGYTKENYEVGVTINDLVAIKQIEKDVFLFLLEYRAIITDPIQPLIIFLVYFLGMR